MEKNQFLIQFVKKIQSRSNLGLLLSSLIKMSLIGSFLAILVSLTFLFQGFHVPLIYPIVIIGFSILTAIAYSIYKKLSLIDAAKNGDQYFKLKDGLVSAFTFMKEGKSKGVFDLQSDDAYHQITTVNPTSYPLRISSKLLALAVLLLLTTGALLQIDDSPRVKKDRAVAIETNKKSIEIKEELEKKIEDLMKDLDDEEKEKVRKSKLFEMVKKLEAEKSPEKLALKIAKLEKKLKDLMKKNNTKSEEKLLSKLAKELKDKKKLEKMGKALSKKEYKNAQKEMDKLKLDKLKNAKNTKNKKEMKKQMEKRWKDKLDSWKKLSKAMKKSLKASSSKNKSSLSKEFDKFAQSTDKLAKEIDKLEEIDPKDLEEIEKQMQECKACKNQGNKDLDKISKSLKGLSKKKSFYKKMSKLQKSMQQCQSYAMGMQRVLSPGGKKAGAGADAPNRKMQNLHENNDQYTKLKGTKGNGKSFIKVEEASSGTGISSTSGVKQSVKAKKQIEAFIQREEVPSHLKDGVKKYFIDVHGTLEE